MYSGNGSMYLCDVGDPVLEWFEVDGALDAITAFARWGEDPGEGYFWMSGYDGSRHRYP